MGALIALVLAALALSAPQVIDTLQGRGQDPAADSVALSEPFVIDELPHFAGDRPDYRYSVISGGAYDGLELSAAMRNDPVVAAHYAQVDPSRVRAERVTRDRLVFVSYRKGNDVYWTRNKVLLRQGETILTDGKTLIRAKCGNCISEQPLLPTSESEPEVVEFDRLTEAPASTVDDPIVTPLAALAAAQSPVAAPAVGALAQVSPETPLTGPAATGPTTPLAASTRGARSGDAPEDPPGPGNPPGPGTDLPPFVGLPQPPFGGPDPSDPFGPDDELFPDPPKVPEDDLYPPPGTPGGPTNPVPVPEPGTLLLMGAALEIVRRLRSRARQRAARKPEGQINSQP